MVLSANCQGLRNKEKCQDVISYMKDKRAQMICLQDTHWLEQDTEKIRAIWGNEVIICEGKSNSRGVAVLLNGNFEYEILSLDKDTNGNYLGLLLKLSVMTIYLLTVYGPNKDSPEFYWHINKLLQKYSPTYKVICGDFNLVLNPEVDTYNYKTVNNPKARQELLNLI